MRLNNNSSSPNSGGSLTGISSNTNSNGSTNNLIGIGSGPAPLLKKGQRSTSMAYPAGGGGGGMNVEACLARAQFATRKNTKAVACCAAFLFVLVIVTSDAIHDMGRGGGRNSGNSSNLRGTAFASVPASSEELMHWGGAMHAGQFDVKDSLIVPSNNSKESSATKQQQQYHFATVTDLDQLSAVPNKKSKPEFQSFFVPGILTHTSDNFHNDHYDIQFQSPRTLVTKHNEAGRGAEFSELTVYNNRLLTFDDRTGDVFEIVNNDDGTQSEVIPRFVISEGEGDTDKGMKWEWATVKDNLLYMGSMGKEYTRPDGSILNENNLWIGILNARGELRRENWKPAYSLVRQALDAEAPHGYIIMEAILWSEHLRKWVFLPRRISSTPYEEVQDEKMGGTKLVLVDEAFTKAKVVDIKIPSKDMDPLRGFSSFAFVPGTQDKHAITIRSVEEDCTGPLENCKQRSYFMVLNVLTGDVLSEETKYPENQKFEGIEFVNIFQKPTQR